MSVAPKSVLRAMLASDEGIVQRIDGFYVAGSINRCWQLWGLDNRSICQKSVSLCARVSALRVISISLAHTLLSFYFDGDMRKLEMANVE